MSVVVTGGAGFVGSHLCDALAAQGRHVVAVDNLLTGSRDNLDRTAVELIVADVSDREWLDWMPDDVEYVYHLASPASPVDYAENPIETLQVGSQGTFNALELAFKNNARFLFTSTSEVYGDPLIHPQPETYWGHVNPVGVRSCYDEAKRFGEAATIWHKRVYSVDAVIVRIFNTYGPRMRPNDGRAIPNFISQALSGKPITVYGDGGQTRSVAYVTDTVNGLIAAAKEHGYEGPVNIGNPYELSMLELARAVKELTGSSSEITFESLPEDDPKQRRPDIHKAMEDLGWEPSVKLTDGLQQTIDWMRANP